MPTRRKRLAAFFLRGGPTGVAPGSMRLSWTDAPGSTRNAPETVIVAVYGRAATRRTRNSNEPQCWQCVVFES